MVYGNPNRTLLPFLNTDSYLDSLLPELCSYPYPDVNSQEAVDEINELIKLTNQIADNEEAKKRFLLYDEDFETYLINVMVNTGAASKEEVEGLVKDLHADIIPIIVKLKYFYQRIRPTQLALMFQMSMYPFKSSTADTPSYPSGHSIQSKIYCEVLGNKYPKFYKQLKALSDNISDSRLYLGVHYPSDATFSMYVCDVILAHPEFKKKYKL